MINDNIEAAVEVIRKKLAENCVQLIESGVLSRVFPEFSRNLFNGEAIEEESEKEVYSRCSDHLLRKLKVADIEGDTVNNLEVRVE